MPQPIVVLASALAGLTAIASFCAFRIFESTYTPPDSKILSSDTVPDDFAHSFSGSVVNPHRHITINDTRSIAIPVSIGVSQEQLLASFLSGFFGGYVFALERGILRLTRKELVNFKSNKLQSQLCQQAEH